MTGDPLHWSKGLKLEPSQYMKLGRLLGHADGIVDLAASMPGDDDDDYALAEDVILSGQDLERAAVRNLGIELARESAARGDWGPAIELTGSARGAIDLVNGSPDTAFTDELLAGDGGYGGPALDDLAFTDAVITAGFDFDAQRQDEDFADETERRLLGAPSAEKRLARALSRIEAGTYVPEGEYARGYGDPDDLSGRHAPQNCGISDYYGRCSASDHAPSCSHNLGNPAGLDVHEIEAWRAAMNRRSGPRMASLQPVPQREATDYHQLAVSLGISGPGPDRRSAIGEGQRVLGGGYR